MLNFNNYQIMKELLNFLPYGCKVTDYFENKNFILGLSIYGNVYFVTSMNKHLNKRPKHRAFFDIMEALDYFNNTYKIIKE